MKLQKSATTATYAKMRAARRGKEGQRTVTEARRATGCPRRGEQGQGHKEETKGGKGRGRGERGDDRPRCSHVLLDSEKLIPGEYSRVGAQVRTEAIKKRAELTRLILGKGRGRLQRGHVDAA